MKNKRLEDLSELVRKGTPIDLKDAFEVVEYQTKIVKEGMERTKKRLRILKSISAIVITIVGTLAVVFGEMDDSPGLGGIGLILIGGAMYLNAKLVNEK
jgi:hypothetical protein